MTTWKRSVAAFARGMLRIFFHRAKISAAGVLAFTAMSASQALAQQAMIPGVGGVVKHDKSTIIAPSDTNGEVRLTGLTPGLYTIAPLPIGGVTFRKLQSGQTIRVGKDGRLAFVSCQNGDGARQARKVNIKKCMGRKLAARQAPGAAQQWVEPIAFDETAANSVVFDMLASFTLSPPIPCAPPPPGVASTCTSRLRNFVDVNASTAEEIVRLAPNTSAEAAAFIVAERTKNSVYKNLGDFTRRVGTKASINFDGTPARFGLTSVVLKRGGEPKANGFKNGLAKAGGEPEVTLFGATFPLVNLLSWLL